MLVIGRKSVLHRLVITQNRGCLFHGKYNCVFLRHRHWSPYISALFCSSFPTQLIFENNWSWLLYFYPRFPTLFLFTRLRTMALARPLGIWRRRFLQISWNSNSFKGLKYFYNWGSNDAIFYQRLINDWTFLHWAGELFAPPLSKLINSGWWIEGEGSGLTEK